MSKDELKNLASLKALEYVKKGMLLGLGTGSTATFFIKNLIEKCKDGLQVQAVATSIASEKLAREGGIPILDINEIVSLDLTIDGADEIDPQKQLIKGAGGALMREKIIANMSREMIVIADESKLVDKLGKAPLPVEVIPFGIEAIRNQLSERGYSGSWRKSPNGKDYLTDNHNRIFDIHLPSNATDFEKIHQELLNIPGIVDTGFFFNLASKIIIAMNDQTVMVKT